MRRKSCKRDLNVDSVGEQTIRDGNEFQTQFVKKYLVASTGQVWIISLRLCPTILLRDWEYLNNL